MYLLDDQTLVLAASDLTNHLACPHLTQQRLAIARGERTRPKPVDDPHAELIRERGNAHEAAQLERLTVECHGCVDLSTQDLPSSRAELEAAAAETADAMRSGAKLIFQGHFFDGRWQGRTDFLRRIDHPSGLGSFAYEVLDTKLYRGKVKPTTIHQLALYSRLVGRVQGIEPPRAYVILGDGHTESIELRRYAALHRHAVRRLEDITAAASQETYPEPIAHCDICQLSYECEQRRRADDHLSLVANARRDQRKRLVSMQIPTVAALAEADPTTKDVGALGAERFEFLHHQAALQVESRLTREPRHRHLAPKRAAGYAALPEPDEADIFFDFEGDPYVGDGGIEYLWGWWTKDGGYECVWAHDANEEKAALERFVDYVVERRRTHPNLHVYHYAAHERSRLGGLTLEYATREAEVDQMLRDGVLVDLYSIVRRALQVGEESYSLKRLERHHGFTRLERGVREGGGSIVAYESWLETGDDDLLEAIRAYNQEDCTSTRSLRDWLAGEMAPEAATKLGVDFADYREAEPEDDRPPPEWMDDALALIERLTAGLSADGADDDPDQAERRLLAHLVLYHYRESKPQWWRYYELRSMPLEELVYERDALSGLVLDESKPPEQIKQSRLWRYTFPPQELKLDPDRVADPVTGKSVNVAKLGSDHVIVKKRAAGGRPTAQALVPQGPIDAKVLRHAIVELAESVLARDGRFAATRALLRRDPPRLGPDGVLGEQTGELISATLTLEESILPVQGPPGTGKTYRGARMIVAALQAGLRVGVTAQSHAAIQNMLHDVEEHAGQLGASFSGIYKGAGYDSLHGLIEETDDNGGVTDDHQLVAGTSWLLARPEHREQFDLVFVDEAGQLSLASTAAVGLAAKSLVFLGDPQQLPQVTQADHPFGAGASVLEHLLDGDSTIGVGRGVLLTESWRMHPEVCAFVSERSYDRRLRSRDACSLRGIDAPAGQLSGTGLRVLDIQHEHNSRASPEEADAIAAACRDLLDGAMVTDDQGEVTDLQASDIMVVAPYNLAVRCIGERVPAGVRVGTVDRFQGQQAPVVFFAMTSSSGEDVPRGLDFLFDRNRLNVAVSRAQCLAVLVRSPQLLDANCRTPEVMRLVDGVCRFGEMAP